ncbi:hypothetical protein SZN_10508 [Streptomyces zinciresistens K42]|uniref:Uncharacterized protein n=1 Tax=Streptomyces zinciresistens K42 TaxID=700597 RepID=G2G9I8_9ACTN|nr:hypothetical protein [Streptomyces zinciresistens]EGX59836.1 hypothetical protein SZN_10508 [Streptomyces zinciresistens K42]
MVEAVVAQACERGEAHVADPPKAAWAVVAQSEGQVRLAKLHRSTERPGPPRGNRLALPCAR